ncbi:hypothetical protein GC722_12100 [Auraticoccus sp. F435]|uniref:Outer membrane channel protein CpnT-like N-terminal domain-containing protein n=1 Tax=Auraticoccus cholistanensis TaxID=2656650 RepID=A0A6A9V141_9ACTN|nr:hypothetical protein [Auraticoccus cholistanensis]MVA76759.1 hypothetical protein [Auraticoccus cholistanensis]
MGVVLPGEVSYLLNMLGFTWPNVDEAQVFEKGGEWQAFASGADATARSARSGVEAVLAENQGPAMTAFRKAVAEGEDPVQSVVQDLSAGSSVVGASMYVMAGVVIALKVTVVVQLVVLAVQIASAIAAAVPTFGSSLTLIPLFKIAAKLAIELAINLALEQLMG